MHLFSSCFHFRAILYKSGKTVLCRRNVPKNQQILISGGEVANEEEFWNLILNQLDCSYTDSSIVETSSTESVNVTNNGQLTLFGVATGGREKSTTQERGAKSTHIRKHIINPKRSAIDKLIHLNKTLIIDDFHYIEQGVQQQIIRSLKAPIFDGLNVIVLAVPHRAYDALKVETEMTGRVAQLSINFWTQDDLAQIAIKGFNALNIKYDESLVNALASESYGSPNLMQEFCFQLCKQNNIEKRCNKKRIISFSGHSNFFSYIAHNVASKVAYEKLARGPRQRTDRKPRILKTGNEVDIYTATLLAIAHTGPKTEITIEDLRTSFRRIMDNPPQSQEVARVLVQMDKIAKSIPGEPVIDWAREDNSLFIADPYFAFYLKWAIK